MKYTMKKNFIGLILGILILIFIFYNIGFGNIVDLFLKIRMKHFIAALFVHFLVESLTVFIIKVLIKAKFTHVFLSHLAGMLFSVPTPGRVGYFYTAYSLSKKTKYSLSENIGYLALLQGLVFFFKIFLCLVAVVYFSSFIVPSLMGYLIIAIILPVIFFIGIFLLLFTKLLNRLIKKIIWFNWLEKHLESMQKAMKILNKKKIFIIFILNLTAWVVLGFEWFLLAGALNIDITFLTALMLQPLLTTIMFFPLTPSGLGFAEGGSALIFNLIGFSSVIGVTFLLLQRFTTIIVHSFGLIDLKVHKIKLKKVKI